MALQNNTLSGEHVRARFLNSARRMGLTRNRNWLKRMIDKDKIKYLNFNGNTKLLTGPIIKKRFAEKLFQLIEVFERKFDKNWDIHLEYDLFNQTYEIQFLIHYKEVEITNSENASRILTDLVVVLPISYNRGNVYVRRIEGTRLTIAEDEWTCGYGHSHLPSRMKFGYSDNPFQVSKFCIGSEDLSELHIMLTVDFDIVMFESMLYVIDSLVSWESLEGGPHIRMEKIVTQSDETLIDPNQDRIEDMYLSFQRYYLSKTIKALPFEFVYNNNAYRIKQNSKFTEFVKQGFLTTSRLSQYIPKLFCKKGVAGYYTDTRLVNTANNTTREQVLEQMKQRNGGELPFVYIQGEKIHFDIKSVESNPLDINEFGIHPNFLNYVTEQLESKIYKACVRGSSINRLSNTSPHVRRIPGQDQIFV